MAIVAIKADLTFVNIAPKVKYPDLDAIYFGRKGEFSPDRDFAFKRHERCNNRWKQNSIIQKSNGSRIKLAYRYKMFWY